MTPHITLEDLIIAYRKAKVDTFYETGHLTSQAFAEYENNLIKNLEFLRGRINTNDLIWFEGAHFIGSYYCSLKSLDIKYKPSRNDLLFYSNSKLNWNNIKSLKPDFRVIGNHSVDFHVFSSLWIEKVGLYLEQGVGDNSYGCRLRYSTATNKIDNEESIGLKKNFSHFRSYLNDYQRWQYNGIERIKKAIADKIKVVAITADFKKYYHRIDSSFITEPSFLNSIQFGEYSPLQNHLNGILLHAISSWSHQLYNDPNIPSDFKYNGHCGVPMGLGAAKVIANLLLTYLDKKLETELKPIYYGRYVDDIFLVLEDGNNLKDSSDFWRFIKRRIKEIVGPTSARRKRDSGTIPEYKPSGSILKIPYAKNSLIEFGKNKEKFFFLEGVSGESFLNTLQESLEENSSEWKLPPNTDNDLESFSDEMANASSDHQESANGLRKSDGVSIRRLKLILFLKRFEIGVSILPKKQWEIPLEKFFDLVVEFTITPETLATYSKYYPRIIGLAIRTGNITRLNKIIDRIDYLYEKLKDESFLKESDKIRRNQIIKCLHSAKKYQDALLAEGIYQNFDPFDKSKQNAFKIDEIITRLIIKESSVQEISKELFAADLHLIPFKEAYLYPVDNLNIVATEFSVFYDTLLSTTNLPNYHSFRRISKVLWERAYPEHKSVIYPFALYFFTRPFTLLELSLLFPQWHRIENVFSAACQLFHIDWSGYSIDLFENNFSNDLKKIVLDAPENHLNKVIAFTSLETKSESWVSVVREDGAEPDLTRKQRILDLCADIIKCRKVQIDYVLFPELSIPRKLILYISSLFLKKKISVIAGIEYKIKRTGKGSTGGSQGLVSNQLVYILCVPGKFSLQHVSIIQEKIIPAQEEERQLFDIGGKYMSADDESKYLINHGGFWFSGLICNDFLDIDNRAVLRGLIDALIVIEWNKDINTYNALVEASANDIHSFILQVNNRLYGDTRLRGPYKEEFERDKVRVRGGELDYFVVATLDVDRLREFQRNHRSPDKPFKPVPTGFKMSDERKKITKGESDK